MDVRLKMTAFLLTITGIFVASNIYTMIPIYEQVAGNLQIKENHTVLAGSLFSFFYALGLLYFGPASDRFGRRRVILLGMLASAISTLFVGLAKDATSLYVARSLQGFTLGSFAPVAFAYTFDLFTNKKRTLLLVFINTGFLMAGIIGQLISSSITAISSWNHVFFFFAGTYLLLFLISSFILPKTSLLPMKNNETLRIMRELLQNKNLLKCYLIAFTLLFSFVALYDGMGRFFKGTAEELFMLRAVGLSGAILSLFTGRLLERIGVNRTLYLGFGLAFVSLFILSIFKSLGALFILSITFVASISLLIPTIITLVGTFGGAQRAKALSIYSFVLLTGASIASPIVMLVDFQSVLLLLLIFFVMNIGIGVMIQHRDLIFEKK